MAKKRTSAETATPEGTDSKAISITAVGNSPFVIDDKGNGWGTSISSRVEGLSDVIAVSAADQTDAVIKKDGTLWMWGYDKEGLFGGAWSLQLTPVQVELKPSPQLTSNIASSNGS